MEVGVLLWTETLLPIGWHLWWVPQCVESCLASLASGTAEWDPASASAVAKTQEELNEAMGISRQPQRHSDTPWRRISACQHHVLQSKLKSYWLSHHERCEPCPPHVSSSGAVLGNHWVIEPHKCQAGRQCEPSLKSLLWPGRDQTHNLPVLFSGETLNHQTTELAVGIWHDWPWLGMFWVVLGIPGGPPESCQHVLQ